jgi:hypothetical protein
LFGSPYRSLGSLDRSRLSFLLSDRSYLQT